MIRSFGDEAETPEPASLGGTDETSWKTDRTQSSDKRLESPTIAREVIATDNNPIRRMLAAAVIAEA